MSTPLAIGPIGSTSIAWKTAGMKLRVAFSHTYHETTGWHLGIPNTEFHMNCNHPQQIAMEKPG